MIVLLLLYGLMNDWIGPNDGQYQTKNSPWGIDEVYEALLADRKGRYLSDWFISTAIMAITAGLIWFYPGTHLYGKIVFSQCHYSFNHVNVLGIYMGNSRYDSIDPHHCFLENSF